MAVTKPLRIAIATGGRFHVLDLARELDALGHEVQFYSYVPKARALKFGLPAHCHVSLLPLMWPLVAWERLQPKAAPELREKLLGFALNRAVMARLEFMRRFHWHVRVDSRGGALCKKQIWRARLCRARQPTYRVSSRESSNKPVANRQADLR